MSNRLIVIVNSLITVLLFLLLAAAIYEFIQTQHLTGDVSSLNRQIGELKEVASKTLEQTIRRLDGFGRQLNGIAPASKQKSSGPIAAAHAKPDHDKRNTGIKTPVRISQARQSARLPDDPRKAQEIKLNRDRVQFLRLRAQVCDNHVAVNASKAATRRCNEGMKLLAENGNSTAQKWLATLALEKQHDLQLAISLFEEAANQGDTEAMDNLGSIYAANQQETNPIVSAVADPSKALYWYGKSASLGNANAMGGIADIYQHGRLTPQNPREAVLWYELATEAVALSKDKKLSVSVNFAGALGDIYYRGIGVDQDKVHAYEWYVIACSEGSRLKVINDSSCSSRNNVASELSPVEVAKAQALAAEWKRLHR